MTTWMPDWLSEPAAPAAAPAAPAAPAGRPAAPDPETPHGPPQPPPWRSSLARWPDPWRERWGKRANELETGGLDWRSAEREAFAEVSAERRSGVELPAEAEVTVEPALRQGRLIG